MKLKKSTQIVIGVVAGLILISVLASSGEAEATSTEKTNSKEKTADADTKTATDNITTEEASPALYVSPADFKIAFNKAASENSFEFEIDDIEIVEGKVNNTFSYMFNKNLGLIGTINKADGSLKEISMLGRGDGTGASGANLLGLMAVIITTADPTLPPSGRGDILKDLKLFGDDAADLKDHSAKTEKNGIKYFISSSEMMGIMFGASRK